MYVYIRNKNENMDGTIENQDKAKQQLTPVPENNQKQSMCNIRTIPIKY